MVNDLKNLIGLGENDEAKSILENMIDVDVQDEKGNTPLMYAVYQGNYKIVEYLVDKGTNVNQKNNEGKTPLHETAGYTYMGVDGYEGRKSILKLLIDNNANINEKDKDGNTPLHYAIFKMHNGLVDVILEHGGDCTLKNNNGMTAIDFAVLKQDHEIVSMLEERCEGNQQLRSDLRIAIPSIMSFKNLLNYFMDEISQKVKQGEKGEVLTMISKNRFLKGNTLEKIALNHAVFENKTEIVNSILKRKDVNARDGYGNTLLHFAVYKNNAKLVRKLIMFGAKVYIRNRDGNTPLHLACLLNRTNIVQKLVLRSDAWVLNMVNRGNKTPFDIACERGNEQIKAYIIEQNNQNVVNNIFRGNNKTNHDLQKNNLTNIIT